MEKADGGDGLEVGHAGRAFNQRADFLYQRDDFLPRDLPPIHLDALAEGMHVRRGVETGTVTGGPQAGLTHCRCRAFALCTGDVHRWETSVGVAHSRQQSLDS